MKRVKNNGQKCQMLFCIIIHNQFFSYFSAMLICSKFEIIGLTRYWKRSQGDRVDQ